MVVIGADPHKREHCLGAVDAATGELRSSETVKASGAGHERALTWARTLDGERVWAIEDCRHVSGRLERFLVARGERVVRVPPKLMGGARKSARERGKSDPIDAVAVARAALREGIATLPAAHLDERALEIRLLLDHHDDLWPTAPDEQRRLRWHLHELWHELSVPKGGLDREKWLAGESFNEAWERVIPEALGLVAQTQRGNWRDALESTRSAWRAGYEHRAHRSTRAVELLEEALT
jgi:transposase